MVPTGVLRVLPPGVALVMRTPPQVVLRMFLWNMTMGLLVFLPVFVVASETITASVGFPPMDLASEATNITMFCVILSPTVAIGAIAHSLGVLVLWALGGGRYLRLGTLALAPLVPLMTVALDIPGSFFFSQFLIDTAVATAAYGIAAGMQWPREHRLGRTTTNGGIADGPATSRGAPSPHA